MIVSARITILVLTSCGRLAPLPITSIEGGSAMPQAIMITMKIVSTSRSATPSPQSHPVLLAPHSAPGRNNGIEEELYRLKMKDPSDYERSVSEAHIPEIMGSEADEVPYFDGSRDGGTPTPRRVSDPARPGQEVTPTSGGTAFVHARGGSQTSFNPGDSASWQLVHQRLLNWTIVWSMSELERALDSTERGRQVDECALTVWTTQCYKRYVRSKVTDNPQQKVDRLFVPPNVADAINSAVYNGRHADACSMLKDLWTPFGFDGMPRLILVLARHRRDGNHWVVHR